METKKEEKKSQADIILGMFENVEKENVKK